MVKVLPCRVETISRDLANAVNSAVKIEALLDSLPTYELVP